MDYSNINIYELESTVPNFTDKQLLDFGIVFLNNKSELKQAIIDLVGDDVNLDGDLAKLGLTFGRLSILKNSKLVLYKSNLEYEFIRSAWQNENFYNIRLVYDKNFMKPLEEDKKKYNSYITVEEVKNIYINKDFIKEDLDYYINYSFENAPNKHRIVYFKE